MKYTIKELPTFSVIGLEQTLTEKKSQNLERCLSFWPYFNQQLKRNRLGQKGIWTKYAFMTRREGQFYYFCGIPQPETVPVNFLSKEIPTCTYLVVEHQGAMKHIYATYETLYRELIPKLGLSLEQVDFLHFEKYDEKFKWNQKNSVIEIWVPLKA